MKFLRWAFDKGFNLKLVTGRRERLREVTIRNLERVGLSQGKKGYSELMMVPDNDPIHTAQNLNRFKINAQKEILKRGFEIALMLGDQDSDVQGALGRACKLNTDLYKLE